MRAATTSSKLDGSRPLRFVRNSVLSVNVAAIALQLHGVGHDKASFPLVVRSDRTSRKYKRLYGVAFAFQVIAYGVESLGNVSSNILANNPRRS